MLRIASITADILAVTLILFTPWYIAGLLIAAEAIHVALRR